MTKEEIIKNNQKIDWFNGTPCVPNYSATIEPKLLCGVNIMDDPSLIKLMEYGIAHAKL